MRLRGSATLRRLPGILLSIALGAAAPAIACSCMGFAVEGFIHPDLTVLPANARGALFLAPDSLALAPGMFTVTTASGAPPGKVRIEPVTLPAGHPLGARLPRGSRLVRVGIEGGFAANVHYIVTFRHGKSISVRRDSVGFDIDPARFDLAAQRFAVRLDGPARRTMLTAESGSGSCAATDPALVQDFHIQVPEALRRYLPALSLLAEERDARPGAAYAPVQYSPSMCEAPLIDHGALPAPRELVYRDCGSPVERVHLRAWVGMLEVDARVVAAEPAVADLAPARSTTCSPYGMLRAAIERADAAETAALACKLAYWGEFRQRRIDLNKEMVPTPAQWNDLVRRAGEETAACGMAAMGEMLAAALPGRPDFGAAYLALAKTRLRSRDPAAVRTTIDELAGMRDRMMARREPGRTPALPEDSLVRLLPALLGAADGGGPAAKAALQLIASFGPPARGAVARLRALAEKRGPQAADAIEALASIDPADPGFQQALIGWARRPDLGATPALAFARVAGKSRPREAVALLLPLVRADNLAAIDALAGLGPEAAPATALLLGKMEQGRDAFVRGLALRAAMQVAADDAAAAATLSRKLLGPPNDYVTLSDYMGLAHFKQHAGEFIPVLRQLIGSERAAYQQDELRKLISVMALGKAQKRAMLDQLDRRRVATDLRAEPSAD